MSKQNPQLNWCIVRFGEDANWWVTETSDPVHWDTDSLSILDPRQMAHIVELCEPLREYGFDLDLLDQAFYTFRVEKEEKPGHIRLVRLRDSVLTSEEKLFALPDILNEDKGPYAELLDEAIKARIKLLNDTLNLEHPLTTDDVEEILTERAGHDFSEGRSMHVFVELLSILEYVPEGFEDEMEETKPAATAAKTSPVIDEIPDLEEDESLEADETMKWGDEEEKDKEEDEDSDGEDDEDDEDEDEDEDEKPSKKPTPKKPAPKPAKPAAKGKKKK